MHGQCQQAGNCCALPKWATLQGVMPLDEGMDETADMWFEEFRVKPKGKACSFTPQVWIPGSLIDRFNASVLRAKCSNS